MKKQIAVLALALLTVTAFTGCVALVVGAAAGAGGVAYAAGSLKVLESVPLDTAWKASEKALQQLQLTVQKSGKDGLTGTLEARSAADKKITVRLRRVSDKSTELQIRVGTFGDEAHSRQIHSRIQANF